MIFVTVGTQLAPFDRLMRAVSALPSGEEVIVQCGISSVRPDGAVCVDFLPFDAYVDYIRRARIVISHAGVGSTFMTLLNGKRPIVMPRLKELGEEEADSHQREFACRLHDAGLVVLVDHPDELREAVAHVGTTSVPPVGGSPQLIGDLEAYILSVIERRAVRRLSVSSARPGRRERDQRAR